MDTQNLEFLNKLYIQEAVKIRESDGVSDPTEALDVLNHEIYQVNINGFNCTKAHGNCTELAFCAFNLIIFYSYKMAKSRQRQELCHSELNGNVIQCTLIFFFCKLLDL